ncbi:hypothetical protein ACFRQM_04360 [Streptomyces sp. NPDC056831]|uniref:hypothetical protein n=1 Tax=Streptomyces sp. NPDC056831 TaxID=3345954 RepID=UPI003677FD8F
MPHLPYIDAVHAALVAAGQQPETLTTGETERGELAAQLEWDSVRLRWASDAGWTHEAPHCAGRLVIDDYADPAVLVDIVRLLGDGHPPIASRAEWEHAAALDVALADRADQ